MEELVGFFGSLEFDAPAYLWVIGLLVPLAIFLPWFGKKKGLGIDLQFWGKNVAFKSKRILVLSIPVILASILIMGIMSNPHVISKQVTYIYGYPAMLVVDVSGSMGVGYSATTPFGHSYTIFSDLISRRGDINFGLLIFSTENYIARYFINKDELFQDTLEQVKDIAWISIGTQVPQAMAKARQLLDEKIYGGDKTIILITDLDVPAGEWLRIVEEMTRITLNDIKIYIITPGAALLTAKQSGKDFGPIKAVSMEDKEAINQICNEITDTRMSVIREDETLVKKSLIPFLVLPSLFLIGLCLVLSETRFRKIP
jgi:hypothetical protein